MEIEVETNQKKPQEELPVEKLKIQIEEEKIIKNKESENLKTSLKDKLSSSEIEIRKEGFEKLKHLVKEKKTIEDEILNMVLEEVDMMFNENNSNLKFLILETYFLIIETLEKKINFDKPTFWYYFFDKFLDNKKKELFKKSEEFFNKIINLVDKNNFLDICINLLMKNNSKIIKTIFQILCKKNTFFNFQDKLQKILEAIDKNLTNSNKLIRKKSNDFLKVLIKSFGIEITHSLKKLKPKELEELKKNNQKKDIKIPENENIIIKKKIQKSTISFIQKDLYLKSSPISILNDFPDSWCSKVKNTKKWKIKVEFCEIFLKKAKVNRLEKGNYNEIFSLAKKLILENIIHLQIIGLKMISALAKGLRGNIHNLIKNNFGILISKLKDRKFQVIDQLLDTINHCFYCLSIDEVYEEIKVYNKKRNKDIRMNIISVIKNFFDFVFQKKKKNSFEKFFKLFGKTIDIYFKDQDITIKQANSDMILYIYDFLENSEKFKIFEKYVNLKNLRNKDSRNINKKRRSSYISQLTTPKHSPRKSSRNIKVQKIEDVKFSFFERKIDNEEIKDKIKNLFDVKIIKECEDKNWKIKKNGIICLNGDLEMKDNFFFSSENVNVICQYIMMICNEFKESNLLINKKIIEFFNLMTKLAKDKETVFYYFSKFFIRKIPEKVFFNNLKQSLENLINFVDFHIIFNIITKEIEKNSTPKILTETNKILLIILKENPKYIKDSLLTFFGICFNHTNPEVRNLSTDFFLEYSKSFGTEITSILEKVENKILKENLLKKCSNLIKKKVAKKKEKSKSVKSLKTSKISLSRNSSEKKENHNIYDLIEKINNGDWRQKKFALENYKNFTIQNQKYFSPSNINDTFNCVFRRIKDSHRLVIVAALDCLCFQMKKYFLKFRYFYKKILNEVLMLGNDKNKGLVAEVGNIVRVFKENHQELLVCQIAVHLIGKTDNLDLKIYLLKIVGEFEKNVENLKDDSIITAVFSIIPIKKKIKDFPEKLIKKLSKTAGKQKILKRLQKEKSLKKEKIKSYLKKIFPPTYIQNLNLEFEKPLKKSRYSKKFEIEAAITPKNIPFLNSVLNFTEPEDTEIANLHVNLSSSLNQQLSKKLFSFESKIIQQTFSKITELNVFTLNNIIQFFQITYIRIYDTTRKIIIETFDKFLKYLIYVIKSRNFVFNAEKDTRVIFHSCVRFYLNLSVSSPEIVVEVLGFVNQHLIFDLCFGLLKNRNCFDSEERILVLFEELSKNTKENVFLSIEFVNLLMNLQVKYPAIVLSIFQNLQKNLYFQKFLENPDFKQKFELKKTQNKDKKYNFSDLNQLTEIFESQKIDLLKLSTNMIFIIESILNFADDLIIYQKYTKTDFKKFDKFLFLIEKSCYFKNLLDCLNNFYKQSLFEKLVTYLLILDKKKSEFTFQRENGTLLSSAVIIQRINSVIIRILERNDPNILYDTLFKIIEKCRLNLIKNKNEKIDEKVRKIVIKLTVKILRLEDGKLLAKVDIKKLISLLNLYYGRFKNEIDVNYLKGIKTIVSDLVRFKGTQLYQYYEFVKEKKEPGFLLVINRFLDKYKEKEDFKGGRLRKVENCFKNDN